MLISDRSVLPADPLVPFAAVMIATVAHDLGGPGR
jgi:hypothetical protein